ncbi:MAG TPA: SsrA-binding protein SmpB [Alphaproteobacteria bacterium]|nr:SsrA-binding protein SmpB [Alphaproteobacteria bacterium]
MAKAPSASKTVALNRKARHNYSIEDTLEAGIQLTGTEVKSLREGGVQITDSHAGEMGGELWLFNAHIPEYHGGNKFNHEPRRPRKLLIHKHELSRLIGAVAREGMTLVPLSLYFNPRGRAKVELGLAKGKKKWDKRETEKTRDWQREKGRLLRARG